MNWQFLNSEEQLDQLIRNSFVTPQLIFKHSTRCSISTVVKKRLEKSNIPGDITFHFLDLIAYRSLSNKIAEKLNVHHESPQVVLIKNGECVYDESHLAIQMDEIISQVA
jgi:bacillithiol system protein YtxJ